MKKPLIILLIVLCLVALGVGYYVWKALARPGEVPPDLPVTQTGTQQTTSSPVEATPTFEDGFYQDLSEFFGENQGYEHIQGEYGFTTGEAI
jgi:hypothetical protein